MRVPRRKIYRAFPELDAFSDDECDRLMQRVRLTLGGTISCDAIGVVVLLLAFVLTFSLYFLLNPALYKQHTTILRVLADLGWVIFVFGVPMFSGYLTRDNLLRLRMVKAINWHIERIKCLNCLYLLVGQIPDRGRVTCPECGHNHSLEELGITEADLIPPQAKPREQQAQ